MKNRIRKLVLTGALLVTAIGGTGAVASAHTNGTWHYDGQYVGTQWCVFLTSPTGHSTLVYCYDTFAAGRRVAS